MAQAEKPENVQSSQSSNQPRPERSQERPAGGTGSSGGGMEVQRHRGRTELGRQDASPFTFIRRFMNDMDRLFGDFGFGPSFSSGAAQWPGEPMWEPRVDVFEREGQLVIHADLPGMRDQDVSVQVDNDVLTISGERRHEHEHKKGGVYRCERSYGSFQRSLPLPEGVNPDSIQASIENGLLEVTMPMPKQTGPRGRQVQIRPKGPGAPTVKH